MLDTEINEAEIAGATAPAISEVQIQGIAILGSHPATVEEAPYDDPSWLIWACSPHNVEQRKLPRVDLFCELHDPIEDPTRAFAYLKAVSEMPNVLMRDPRALASGNFKGAKPYPDTPLKGAFYSERVKIAVPGVQPFLRDAEIPLCDGAFCPYMFTSSIAFMLAKAILDCEATGVKNIALFGIMQMSETEYRYQRPGIQYFIWEAVRRGIHVHANRESCLFDLPTEKW